MHWLPLGRRNMDASCESVFNRYLLLYHDLTSIEQEFRSETVHRLDFAKLRFFARIEIETGAIELELQLGSDTLASYELSEARGQVDAETIYSYFLFERPELKGYEGIKQKFIETCAFFLNSIRKK